MKVMCHAFDPSGYLIFLESYLLDKNNKPIKTDHLHSRIAKTIENPTIVFDFIHVCHKRYYFRAIHWDQTLLVCVKFSGGIYEVEQYIEDPSGNFMAHLYRKAKYASF